MAAIRLEPPPPFSFKTPDQWPKWKRRFAQYRLASGLSTESDERQTSTLLYCMGEDAEDTLTSTDISAEDRRSYAAVIAKFDAFFQVRKILFSSVPGLTDVVRKKKSLWNSSSPVCTV